LINSRANSASTNERYGLRHEPDAWRSSSRHDRCLDDRFGGPPDRRPRSSWSGITESPIRASQLSHYRHTPTSPWIIPAGYGNSDEDLASRRRSWRQALARLGRLSSINGNLRSADRHQCFGEPLKGFRACVSRRRRACVKEADHPRQLQRQPQATRRVSPSKGTSKYVSDKPGGDAILVTSTTPASKLLSDASPAKR
jgi:hypothetical protein